jgi:hypothetical protein
VTQNRRHLGIASAVGSLAILICVLVALEVARPAPWVLAGSAVVAAFSGWLLRVAVSTITAPRLAASPDRARPVKIRDVKRALHDLASPTQLARSPLCSLPVLKSDGVPAIGLRALLVDVVSRLASSSRPRDHEAGLVLLNYYVKRVGSHELVMEGLYLSRATFYRRLQRGFELVAQSLDDLNGFAPDVWSDAVIKRPLLAEGGRGGSGGLQPVKP